MSSQNPNKDNPIKMQNCFDPNEHNGRVFDICRYYQMCSRFDEKKCAKGEEDE